MAGWPLLLTAGVGKEDALRTVVDRAREVASADLAAILVRTDQNELDMVVVSGMTLVHEDALPRAPVEGSLAGTVIESGPNADIKVGNALPLKAIPLGTSIHNVELTPGRGGGIATGMAAPSVAGG